MEAENLLLNDRSQGQVVKEISKILPHIGVAVFAEALVIETVNLGNLS